MGSTSDGPLSNRTAGRRDAMTQGHAVDDDEAVRNGLAYLLPVIKRLRDLR